MTAPPARAPLVLAGVLLVATAWLTGCETYQLRGKVVPGFGSQAQVVKTDNDTLEREGVPGVTVNAIIDPDRPNWKRIGPVVTGPDGTFALPVEEPGAGFLEYDVLLVARLKGHRPAEAKFRLPGGDKRVLVELAPGNDDYQETHKDFLEDTLRLSKPYLNE